MIRTVLRQWFTDDTVYECRDCGATPEDSDEECPECGSEEIAEYEFQ